MSASASRDVAAVIPAAGRGERLDRRLRKAFVAINGAPLIVHTLRVFERAPVISSVVVVAHPDDGARMRRLLRRAGVRKVTAVVAGGASRAESVARGVAALPAAVRWVVVHDGARPCLSADVLAQAVRAATRAGAVACALPASLTVKAVDKKEQVRLTLDRDALRFVQTPQVFRRDWFVDALRRVNGALAQFPDDVAILEQAGYPVRLIAGDPWNIKVTTRKDLVLAEAILMKRSK